MPKTRLMVKRRSGVPSTHPQLLLSTSLASLLPLQAKPIHTCKKESLISKGPRSSKVVSLSYCRPPFTLPTFTKSFRSLSVRMSDDEADPELLALLRAHILGQPSAEAEPETGVLEGAEYVYDNSIDVAVDMWSCKTAANAIHRQMQEKSYSTATWTQHELHPKTKDEGTVAFIFTMDLLNFSFWSELPDDRRFAISYRGKTWTGYWSLVAALQRALDKGWSGPVLSRGLQPERHQKMGSLDQAASLTPSFCQVSQSPAPISGKVRTSARWTS